MERIREQGQRKERIDKETKTGLMDNWGTIIHSCRDGKVVRASDAFNVHRREREQLSVTQETDVMNQRGMDRGYCYAVVKGS